MKNFHPFDSQCEGRDYPVFYASGIRKFCLRYLNKENIIFFLTISFWLTTYSLPGQSSHCVPGQVQNENNDLWSEECYLNDQCEEQGNPCAANDVTLLGVYVADSVGGPIAVHHIGDVITFYLWGAFENNTSADRHAVRTVSEVIADGVFSAEINNCSFDSLGPGMDNAILLEEITYVCGQQLQLQNTWVAWSTSHGQCSDPGAANYRSECGQYSPSQCSKEFGLIDFLSPNFQFYCGDATSATTEICFTNLSTGGTGPLTYLWDFDDNGTSTEENPCHIYQATSGSYTILLTVTDSNGVQASAELMLNLDSLNCCVLTTTCPLIDGGLYECPEDVPAADIGIITVTDSCAPVTITVSESSTGTGCILDTMFITRQYVITDGFTSDTCIQIIRVLDNNAPVLTCPSDITISCVDELPDPDPALVSYTENCNNSAVISFVGDVLINQTCLNGVIIQRTYKALDDCGNADTCVQSITILDDASPELICPDNITVSCTADIPLPDPDAIDATDNCGGTVTVTVSPDVITGQQCPNQYTISRIYTATDVCGNTASCVQMITVFDSTPPVITCPDDITIECSADIPAPNPGGVSVTDNCGGVVDVVFTEDVIGQQACLNQYSIARIYTATDLCGNTATCIQIIDVFDSSAPSIVCPADLTVTCAEDIPDPNTSLVTASNNCGGTVDVAFDQDIFTSQICSNRYTVMRLYTATDLCGNIATCTQLISVFDGVPPTITCPADLTVSCSADVPAPNISSVLSEDNCGGTVTVSVAPDIISNQVCINQYTITRVYTAMDNCGNTATCAQTITVIDNLPPLFACPDDLTLTCADDVPAPNPASLNASDNCEGEIDIILDAEVISNQVCENQYTITRIYKATDLCGNSSTCVQTITISDNISPAITCPADLTVSCAADVPVPDIGTVTTSDNCGGMVDITFAPDIISNQVCENQYTISRVYTATDACGNTNTCVQTITVFDAEPPVIDCPDDITVTCSGDVPSQNPESVITSDNCGGVVNVSEGQDIVTQYVCANNYLITRIYTATDLCGNSSTCAQTIKVFDSTPPTITCPSDITVTCANEVPLADPSTVISSDNCGSITIVGVAPDQVISQECANRYVIARVYTATDLCGNSATCTQLISVFDGVPPTITCPANLTVSCSADVPPANTSSITAQDNCGGTVTVSVAPDIISNQVCINQYTITRVYTAMDNCGNSSSCVQAILVSDQTAPSVIAPPDVSVECADQVPPVNTAIVLASDNCSGSVNVNHIGDAITNQNCINQFLLTRTYQATDACGNTATDSQLITVSDFMPPVITFTDPLIAGVPNGGTVDLQCYGQDPLWDLPQLGTSSVNATDNCGVESLDFSQSLEAEGDCRTDGFINIFRLTWTAVDACGNNSNAFVFLRLKDTIPPVIHDVPADITVNVNNIPPPPSLYATDECLCSCIVFFENFSLSPGCMDGMVMRRSWEATDDCGNVATAEQLITLVDNEAPELSFIHPELNGIENGEILEFTCNEGGIPDFFNSLSEETVVAMDYSNPVTVHFSVDKKQANNCEFWGFIEQRTYRWEAIDECGNSSALSFIVQLNDNEPPVITGIPEMVCVDDVILETIEAIDNCGNPSLRYWDVSIPNPCGNSPAWRRTYEAFDGCGNFSRDTVVLVSDDHVPPLIQFTDPDLSALSEEEIMIINCDASGGFLTPYGVDDVKVIDPCPNGVNVKYEEIINRPGECATEGFLAIIEMRWTASDICGNTSSLSINARIVDNTPPEFINLNTDVTIGCNEDMPLVEAVDNCGEVEIITEETIMPGPCEYEYDILRTITAIDECLNAKTVLQRIHVGDDSGPIINGVQEELCDDLSIPPVTAFDPCASEYVEVSMVEDTLETSCQDGFVIERTWSAVDACGNINEIKQHIIVGDNVPPEILIPTYSIINKLIDQENIVFMSQTGILGALDALDDGSVYAKDDCDQRIIPVFTFESSYAVDCEKEGYFERRRYTWVATDVCGNSSSVTFNIDVIDDIPPVFEEIPVDESIICDEVVPPAEMHAFDHATPLKIIFTESSTPVNTAGEYFITRTWVATDACGNTSVAIQHITWIPDTYLTCDIVTPKNVECNTHGILISSDLEGGIAPFTYQWEIVGEDCFIQGGQNTPEIFIYIGWTPVEIRLTVTDAFGCRSVCSTTMDCMYPVENPYVELPNQNNPETNFIGGNTKTRVRVNTPVENLTHVNFWPNPAKEIVYLSFDSSLEKDFMLTLHNLQGQVIMNEKIHAYKGFNSMKIDVSQINDGGVMMKVADGEEIYTRLIVILKGD